MTADSLTCSETSSELCVSWGSARLAGNALEGSVRLPYHGYSSLGSLRVFFLQRFIYFNLLLLVLIDQKETEKEK